MEARRQPHASARCAFNLFKGILPNDMQFSGYIRIPDG
jgi:hypothetical protein